MRRALLFVFFLLAGPAVLGLAACSTAQAPQPAQFDLGPPPADAAPPANVQLLDMAAPAWLAGPGLAYRLDASDPYRREFYRDSRWAAPPAALLAERLRQRAAASAAPAGTKPVPLRIELEECVQLFEGPSRSRLLLRLRVWRQGDPVPRVFERSEPAGSDAAGAVRATAQAADALIDQLLVWAMGAPPR